MSQGEPGQEELTAVTTVTVLAVPVETTAAVAVIDTRAIVFPWADGIELHGHDLAVAVDGLVTTVADVGNGRREPVADGPELPVAAVLPAAAAVAVIAAINRPQEGHIHAVVAAINESFLQPVELPISAESALHGRQPVVEPALIRNICLELAGWVRDGVSSWHQQVWSIESVPAAAVHGTDGAGINNGPGAVRTGQFRNGWRVMGSGRCRRDGEWGIESGRKLRMIT
jgi:hypothetical protein